jgi:hypothetical protein
MTHLQPCAIQPWPGSIAAVPLDDDLMLAIAYSILIGTWPCPSRPARQLRLLVAQVSCARPWPLPARCIRVRRGVDDSGRIMADRQPVKLASRHAVQHRESVAWAGPTQSQHKPCPKMPLTRR